MRFRAELEDFYVAFSDKSIRQIAETAHATGTIPLTLSTIQKYLYKIRSEQTVVSTIDAPSKWKVLEGKYIFGGDKSSKKVYTIDFIDKLFLFYSRNGYNYTGALLCQRFNLAPRAFQEIKNTFMLMKDSDVISPHTLYNTSPEELEIVRDRQLDELLRSGEQAKRKYDAKVNTYYKKAIEKENLNNIWLDELYLNLSDELPELAQITIVDNPTATNEEICVVMADLHSGAESKRSKISEAYSVEKLIESLDRVATIINSYNSKAVSIYILGDLVETISGLNHLDSFKVIQDGWHGSQAILGTYDILINFISKIYNLVAFGGAGGNHDRLQASNKMSDTGATDIIFGFLERYIADKGAGGLKINYDPVVVVDKFNDFGFIGVHGDKGLHKRNMEYLILKYGIDPTQFQHIMSAHLHSFFCSRGDDSEIGRRVTIPAIITGSEYSDTDVGRGSQSGFVVLKSNSFNKSTMVVENI